MSRQQSPSILTKLKALPIQTRTERAVAERRIAAAYKHHVKKLGATLERGDGYVQLRAARGSKSDFRELMEIADMGNMLRAVQVRHGEIPEIAEEFFRAHVRFLKDAQPPKKSRLQIDANRDVILDGDHITLDMSTEGRGAAICFLQHLISAQGDWRSMPELDVMERAGGCKEHVEIRWDRTRKNLPEPLLALVESNRRKGYRLKPTTWHR